ncbi:S9 family peptidase [Pelomonas sp. CA6]|uniref:dipeptidyl-peptidase 5 n=1 Tax=Pelomonas sp. CA6 TaxID=2907999 RepID=UPI001F4B3C06|nr:S9 family peptidase [Pelomonas sp. CA6]MCH7341987.1 S9 family peptidase [Pelomonas sp. CA6]
MSPRTPRRPAPLDVDALWSLARPGAISLSPDGRRLVASVSQPSMDDNRSSTQLWLMDCDGRAAPRRLTQCGERDSAPAWSPRGDRIAFLARREQQGRKDEAAQLYLIPADGGEAWRASDFAPGLNAFKWMPDGRRVVFSAWVWPGLRGAAAQNKAQRAFDARKESGYLTREAFYRHWDSHLPMGRVQHLLMLDLASGRVTDLFEGLDCELPRDSSSASVFDIHPDGQRIAFILDPAATQRPGNRCALAELELSGRRPRLRLLVDDARWDLAAPRYRPDGQALAFTATEVGRRHTALARPALLAPGKTWQLLGGDDWDLYADAPLRWRADGSALLFSAESRGRNPLWSLDPDSGRLERLVEDGWVQDFDLAGSTLALLRDSASHPARVEVRQEGGRAGWRRLDRFNDARLARHALGTLREVWLKGAQGEPVQLWLTLPPGYDAKKKHPVMHVIHGGPYAAAGDTWSWRWNTQVLASRGHVVAQLNYHGSSGFGFAFRDSIMGRQGQLEQQDLEAATDWLRRQPWVDKTRISATGGSYGGFLVAWLNGHARAGRYRSFVCHAGVFDRVATSSADSYLQRPRDLHAQWWASPEDFQRVLAQSPHSAAARMSTPTLVIHGAQDYRVPDTNGLAYYNLLQARGIPTQLLWFPDENHWVLKPRNSRLWYTTVLDWVQAHERDAPAAKQPARASRKKAGP